LFCTIFVLPGQFVLSVHCFGALRNGQRVRCTFMGIWLFGQGERAGRKVLWWREGNKAGSPMGRKALRISRF